MRKSNYGIVDVEKRRFDDICPRCEKRPRRSDKGYCLPCHAAYMREHRTKHVDLSPLARARANCRSYANVYLRRGKIHREPCAKCGAEKAEMHHEDYSKPLDITWLCRQCHLAHHEANRRHRHGTTNQTRKDRRPT